MLELPKSNGEFTAGTWRKAISGQNIIAIFICPNCGAAGTINGDGANHSIADDGTVTPSIVCGQHGCGFHDFVKLQDWK